MSISKTTTTDEIVSLHPTKRTHWAAHKNEFLYSHDW